MMESTDREILLEIRREQREMRAEIAVIDRRLAIVEARLDGMSRMQDMTLWAVGLAFAALAVIVAFVGVYAPKFWGDVPSRDESGRMSVDDVARLAGILRAGGKEGFEHGKH